MHGILKEFLFAFLGGAALLFCQSATRRVAALDMTRASSVITCVALGLLVVALGIWAIVLICLHIAVTFH
ncbi:hypothetical protein [Streptomyces canus]|uniref:hypothetical protein n=1 Tax=Streptomyces canus TaxID=58343 RepID=UPI002DDA51C0|nr:hypothetical protein [Streptomyces canus]WSD88288.1 hypothetical protein OG925_30190 [Streptomyces canus]